MPEVNEETQLVKYRIIISGTIEFYSDGRDEDIEELLRNSAPSPVVEGARDRLDVAIQEIEEEATDITVVMVELE